MKVHPWIERVRRKDDHCYLHYPAYCNCVPIERMTPEERNAVQEVWLREYEQDFIKRDFKRKNSQAKKLSFEKVLLIKQQLARGVNPKNIAKEFEVTTTNVYRIRNEEIWKHVLPKLPK